MNLSSKLPNYSFKTDYFSPKVFFLEFNRQTFKLIEVRETAMPPIGRGFSLQLRYFQSNGCLYSQRFFSFLRCVFASSLAVPDSFWEQRWFGRNGERFFCKNISNLFTKLFSSSPPSKDLDLESNLETLEKL